MNIDGLKGNFAYIDNQNLYMATRSADEPWEVDMRRLRQFLRDRHNVTKAYLFMGAFELKYQRRYIAFQSCGYILVFREHGADLKGRKKGNVDVDVVFEMMRDALTNAQMEKAVLVSGDGDYFRTVDYLIGAGKFEKALLPSRRNASSLYKRLTNRFYAYLDTSRVRSALERR